MAGRVLRRKPWGDTKHIAIAARGDPQVAEQYMQIIQFCELEP